MERHPIPSVAVQREPVVAKRPPYAPPTATFVPLKLEERLLGCAKVPTGLQITCGGAPSSS
jgi:hypothetical protein